MYHRVHKNDINRYQRACKLIDLQAFVFLALSKYIKLFQCLRYLFRNLFSFFTFEVLKSGLTNSNTVCYKSQKVIK
jgi:hypothetical protein